MVVVVGASTAAVLPTAVALFGPVGGAAAANAFVPAVVAAEAAAAGGAGAAATGVGATILGLGEGAVVGLGVIGSGGSGPAGIALATMVGLIGWAVVGCNKNDDHNGSSSYTWDCWKPVVRDTSAQPSNGMTLRCLAAHPNIQSMALDQTGVLVGNIFGERFCLTPVNVEGSLAFHASVLL